MTGAQFDKNAEKALEYEKSKDDRGKGSTLAYNMYRKPADALNKFLTNDGKPVLKPWHKVAIGAIALVVTGGTFVGVAICAYMMGSAAKQKLYDGSKLQECVNEKFYKKAPEKFDSQELQQVTTQGLVQDVKSQYQTREQEHGRDREERSVEMEVVVPQDRVVEEARAIAATMQGVNSSVAKDEVRAASHVAALRVNSGKSSSRTR